MSELRNQKRGTRAAVVGGAAGLIPAIALAFYSFLSQEPDVAEQRVGYVVLALLFLSPYVLALIASSSPSEKHGWRVLGGMMGPVQ